MHNQILHIIKKRSLLVFILMSGMFIIDSCVEPFDIEGEIDDTVESALVIEATITNEFKQHQILLTRTFDFGTDGAAPESNANVMVLDDQGNIFRFSETEPGIYLSDQSFETQANRDYRLSVTTSNGRNYASDPSQLTQETSIGSVEASRITNDDGEEGMAIMVNTFDPTNSSNLYRYEYEETFLIIAPDWTDTDLVKLVPGDPEDCGVGLVFTGDNNEQICYGSNVSNDIILANTAGLNEDRVSEFIVRFINRDNFILSHRYSVLVRQFVQSPQAHAFFETLEELSQSDNLFSQTQPGLLVGNVFSEDNEDEIVLGYFEVASVSEQRVFFNYEDFFPGEDLPPYAIPCTRSAPGIRTESEFGEPGVCLLSRIVAADAVQYLARNDGSVEGLDDQNGPFVVVPPACGDCTELGSNIRPSFWID